MEEISIVGAGLTGPGIALSFSANGYSVRLYSRTETRLKEALKKISADAKFLSRRKVISSRIASTILKRISPTTELADLGTADIVIESIPEVFQEKVELFRVLDNLCMSRTIFATNTSGLSITRLAERSGRPDKFIGTHFWVPSHLVPLVEVVRTGKTSMQCVKRVLRLLESIHKRPVQVADIPGFIGNRLQYAMMREALSLVSSGVATPSEIDSVVKYGFGSRLSVIGPFETMDLAGINTVINVGSYLFKELDRSASVPSILIAKMRRRELGTQTLKGFYEWDRSKIKTLLERRNEELARKLMPHSSRRVTGVRV